MTNVSFKELTDSIVGYEPHRWFIDRLNLFLEDLSNMQEAKETIYANFSTITLDDLRDIAGRLASKLRLTSYDFNMSGSDAIDAVANAYNSLVLPPTKQQEIYRATNPKPNEFYDGARMGLMGLFGPIGRNTAYQSDYVWKYAMTSAGDYYVPYYKRASHTIVSNNDGIIWHTGRTQFSKFFFVINSYAPNMYRVFDDICHSGLADLTSDYVTPSDWVGKTSGSTMMHQFSSTTEGQLGKFSYDDLNAGFTLTKVGQGRANLLHGTNSRGTDGDNWYLGRAFGLQDYSGLKAPIWSTEVEYQGSVSPSSDYGYDGGQLQNFTTPQYLSTKTVIKLYLNQYNFSALIRQIQDALSVVSLHHDIISTLISARDLSSEQRRIAFIKAARSLLLNIPSDYKTYLILQSLKMFDNDGCLNLANYGHDDSNDKDLDN